MGGAVETVTKVVKTAVPVVSKIFGANPLLSLGATLFLS